MGILKVPLRQRLQATVSIQATDEGQGWPRNQVAAAPWLQRDLRWSLSEVSQAPCTGNIRLPQSSGECLPPPTPRTVALPASLYRLDRTLGSEPQQRRAARAISSARLFSRSLLEGDSELYANMPLNTCQMGDIEAFDSLKHPHKNKRFRNISPFQVETCSTCSPFAHRG
jgi:hypothetical protein